MLFWLGLLKTKPEIAAMLSSFIMLANWSESATRRGRILGYLNMIKNTCAILTETRGETAWFAAWRKQNER
jgi:hypothetical protein